jgi:hypothetical protein
MQKVDRKICFKTPFGAEIAEICDLNIDIVFVILQVYLEYFFQADIPTVFEFLL